MRSMPAPCSEARGGNHSLAVSMMPATGISQTVRASSRLWTGCIGANLLVRVAWSQGPRRGSTEVSNRVLLDLIEFVDKQEPARRRFHPVWRGAYGAVGGPSMLVAIVHVHEETSPRLSAEVADSPHASDLVGNPFAVAWVPLHRAGRGP